MITAGIDRGSVSTEVVIAGDDNNILACRSWTPK